MSELSDKMDDRARAWAKSFHLLMENLTQTQVRALSDFGFIPVHASDSSRWLVLPSTVQNAFDFDNEEMWCMTMEDRDIPPGDVILGVALSIQGDVDEFRDKANKLDTYSWKMSALNNEAYVSSMHMAALNQTYMPWRRQDMGVSEKQWQDFLSCNDDECNLDDRENVCEFHRGAYMMMSLINDGNTFKVPRQLKEPLRQGVNFITSLLRGQLLDHDTAELLFSDNAETLLDIYDAEAQRLADNTAMAKMVLDPITEEYGKRILELVDPLIEQTFGKKGY